MLRVCKKNESKYHYFVLRVDVFQTLIFKEDVSLLEEKNSYGGTLLTRPS